MSAKVDSAIHIDTSRFPIVVMTIRGRVEASDLDGMMRRYDELLDAGERYFNVVVQDEGVEGFDAIQRRVVADWQREREALVKRVNVGTAIVLTSAVMRGALTALQWLAPPPTPQRSFATRDEALAWAREALIEAGLEPPA